MAVPLCLPSGYSIQGGCQGRERTSFKSLAIIAKKRVKEQEVCKGGSGGGKGGG